MRVNLHARLSSLNQGRESRLVCQGIDLDDDARRLALASGIGHAGHLTNQGLLQIEGANSSCRAAFSWVMLDNWLNRLSMSAVMSGLLVR